MGETKYKVVHRRGDDQSSCPRYTLICIVVAVILFALICLTIILVLYITGYGFGKGEGHPKLQVLPKNDVITFNQGLERSSRKYIDQLTTFLDQYENVNQDFSNVYDCDSGKPADMPPTSFCRYALEHVPFECSKAANYGFEEGRPCVVLSLEKIEGWRPTFDSSIKFEQRRINFTCEGKEPADKENIGLINICTPPGGIPEYNFPYFGQDHYKIPFVMAQFASPTPGVAIGVICKAHSQNLDHSKGAGIVEFLLQVD